MYTMKKKSFEDHFQNDAAPMVDSRPDTVRELSSARCVRFLGNAAGMVEYTEVAPESAAKLLGVMPDWQPVPIGVFEGELVISTGVPEQHFGTYSDRPMPLTRGEMIETFVGYNLSLIKNG